MKHKVIRIALVVAEAFVGLWAVIGGVALVTGAIPFISFPLALLQGTPFRDYTIPGLALLILVGGSSLFAAACQDRHPPASRSVARSTFCMLHVSRHGRASFTHTCFFSTAL
jgi:hypothetical protein